MAQAHDEKDLSVSFNVGGRIFVVYRLLLDAFPSTILARSASEEWFGNNADKPIFIDRDSDRFQYCLDYMRDGRVGLPPTESKAALLAELTYYGFENVDPTAICTTLAAIDVARGLDACQERSNKEMAALEKSLIDINAKLANFKQANILFQTFAVTGETIFEFLYHSIKQNDAHKFYCHSFESDFFNECLATYGLRVLSFKRGGECTDAVISLTFLD